MTDTKEMTLNMETNIRYIVLLKVVLMNLVFPDIHQTTVTP